MRLKFPDTTGGHPYGLVMMDPVEGYGLPWGPLRTRRRAGAFSAFAGYGASGDYGAPLKFNTWWWSSSKAGKCPEYKAAAAEWVAAKAAWKRTKAWQRTRTMKNEGKALEQEGKAAWKMCKARVKEEEMAAEAYEYDPYVEETYTPDPSGYDTGGYDPGGYTPPPSYPPAGYDTGTGNGAPVGGIPPILLWGGAAVGSLLVLSMLFK
jgi:hypothetical protein